MPVARLRLLLLSLLVVGLVCTFSRPGFAQLTLTGAIEFGTDNAGNANGDFWNTLGGDFPYNLYVNLNGVPINSGDGALASINVPLAPGTYNFQIFGNPGTNNPFHGLNLFFNGNNTNPGISVFAPTATNTGSPAFSANSNANTRALNNTSTPGSGSTSFTANGLTAAVTAYRWEASTVSNQDLISPYDRTLNGIADNLGSFTVIVGTEVPEPGTLALLSSSLLPLGSLLLRKRRRKV